MNLKSRYYFSGRFGKRSIRCLMGVALMMDLLFMSCSRDPVDLSLTELVRVGETQITVKEFKQIQDMSQDYYWEENNAAVNGAESQNLRMLDQVIEELLIEEHAKTLRIKVSEADINAAIQNIRSDYPEDTFEQVLLENAVSFDGWRKRLGVRLLIDKVIEEELENHVTITSEDIASYYKKHYAKASNQQHSAEALGQNDDINEIIVKRIRKLKAEKNYKKWMKELQRTYPVHINWEAWKRVQASK
jgi:FKBP-type peptidyl-prolyl cis-trans isomerase (trigger factor)